MVVKNTEYEWLLLSSQGTTPSAGAMCSIEYLLLECTVVMDIDTSPVSNVVT